MRQLFALAIIVLACAGCHSHHDRARQAFMVSTVRTGSGSEVMGYCPDLEISDLQSRGGLREPGRRYTARCQGVTYHCVDITMRTGVEAAALALGGGDLGTRVRSCERAGP